MLGAPAYALLLACQVGRRPWTLLEESAKNLPLGGQTMRSAQRPATQHCLRWRVLLAPAGRGQLKSDM